MNIYDKTEYSYVLLYVSLFAYVVSVILYVFAGRAQHIEKDIPKSMKLKKGSAWVALVGALLLLASFLVDMIMQNEYSVAYMFYITLILIAFAFNVSVLVQLHQYKMEEDVV